MWSLGDPGLELGITYLGFSCFSNVYEYPICQFPRASATKYHRWGGLKQLNIFPQSSYRRSKVRGRSASRAMPAVQALGEDHSVPVPFW